MRFFLVPIAVLLAPVLLAADPDFRPGAGIDEKFLREMIAEQLTAYRVPGAAVAVVKDGKPILVEGFGVRLAGQPAKVDADTIFQLASVSKTFTAAATATMVDAGKIAWDQPVSEVLPGFEMATPYTTKWMHSRDLLTHRAGFEGFFGDIFDHLGFERADILPRLRHAEPGYSFRDHPEYSNLGFFVAGEAAARVNGTTFEELVAAKITDPLGMTRTGQAAEWLASGDANLSAHHQLVNGEAVAIPRANTSPVFAAAGGLASTANDLARYVEMLLAGGTLGDDAILTEDGLATMFNPVIADEPGFAEFPPISETSGFDYSPGWGVYHYNGHRIIEKGGALDGIRTIIVLVPDAGLGIAVLANLNLTAFPEAVRAGILQRELGRSGEADLQPEILAKNDRIEEMLLAPEERPADAKPTPQPFDAYVGSYTNDLFGTWRIELNPDQSEGVPPLLMKAGPAAYRGTIVPWNGDTMHLRWPIVISGPTEIDFDQAGFTFLDYEFTKAE